MPTTLTGSAADPTTSPQAIVAADGDAATSANLAVTPFQAVLNFISWVRTKMARLDAANEFAQTCTFDQPVNGATPTSAAHLTRKDYVDNGLGLKANLSGAAFTGEVTVQAGSGSPDGIVVTAGSNGRGLVAQGMGAQFGVQGAGGSSGGAGVRGDGGGTGAGVSGASVDGPGVHAASINRGALHLYPQSAPSSPQDGDMWVETGTNTLKVRINGVTKTVTLT